MKLTKENLTEAQIGKALEYMPSPPASVPRTELYRRVYGDQYEAKRAEARRTLAWHVIQALGLTEESLR